MTFGSLFAGIGGFDLGFERAGLTCAWQVENHSYCQRILIKNFPRVTRWDDVRTFPPTDPENWKVDIICGGFPCQDISNAGQRMGIEGKESSLWYEFSRIVSHLRPKYIVVENVSALSIRGLGTVLGDLSKIGYDAIWSNISACTMGAPHMRQRLFIVAYPTGRCLGHNWWKQWERLCNQIWKNYSWRDQSRIPRIAYGVPDRVDRVERLGNAVLPQIAEMIGNFLKWTNDGNQ